MTNLEMKIVNVISSVPGLVGLAKLEFSKKPTILKEENLDCGISIEKTKKGLIIKVASIISIDVNAKLISNEISASVKNVLKESNQKLDKVIVYIRGVK